MLSCLSQKSFIATSEMFHCGLPRIGQKFSVRKRKNIPKGHNGAAPHDCYPEIAGRPQIRYSMPLSSPEGGD
jgi:hypothetical protein